MATHSYGWRPSLPDYRHRPADTTGLSVLPEVDPRGEMQAPYDQGQLGSCTANAVAGCIEYDAILNGDSFGTPSRLFIYYGERAIEGTLGQGDTGAQGHDGFKVARKLGTPPETDWPYDILRFQDRPTVQAFEDARSHRISEYRHPAQDEMALKQVLSNNQTVAFGFTVYESFESPEVAQTGIMPIPERGEQILGGHEVLLVGYLRSEPEYALVRNSWGTEWGLGGYFLFPWALLLHPGFASDFRTIPRPTPAASIAPRVTPVRSTEVVSPALPVNHEAVMPLAVAA